MSLIYRYKPDKDRAILPLASTIARPWDHPQPGHGLRSHHLHDRRQCSPPSAICTLASSFSSSAPAWTPWTGPWPGPSGRCTDLGRYLDSVCDRCSELAFIAGAVIGGSPLSALFVVAGSMALLLARVHVHRRGLRSDKARFSRPERLAFIIIALLVPFPFNTIIFLAAGTLSLISAVQVLYASRRARASPRPLEPATSALKNI